VVNRYLERNLLIGHKYTCRSGHASGQQIFGKKFVN
jgi:hypothetical protein